MIVLLIVSSAMLAIPIYHEYNLAIWYERTEKLPEKVPLDRTKYDGFKHSPT